MAKASKPKTPINETKRAKTVLRHAKASIKHFGEAFDTVRKNRKASGPPTAGEQDLIRASLVFSAAGLDSVAKELIRGSIKTLADNELAVQAGLEEFARRQLREDSDGLSQNEGAKFLAKILASTSPYNRLIESYIIYLTGNSLQSVDELFKTANALCIDNSFIGKKKDKLRESFEIRNKIIHELDVRFNVELGQKKRNSRQKADLEERAQLLLDTANQFITAVDKKIISYA